ncbi:MAG: aminopeptidase P family protein [Litoreibacter sp.]|nr:aminopeptidase P family protein [Litoreibacter sp.]
MFQTFEATTSPHTGAKRLAALREAIAGAGFTGFLIPRADAHQGEYVAPCDERLSWLTGFTGSAGFCAVLPEIAGVFIDGRYRVQVKAQVDTDQFTPVPWPETKLERWLREQLRQGKIGFDPWLHTKDQIDTLTKELTGSGINLVSCENLVDRIWHDRPAAPAGKVENYPVELSGKTSVAKRAEISAKLAKDKQRAAVLTLPDSIAWLLNIRGSDIPRIPIVQSFAILHASGKVDLFADPGKFEELPADPDISVLPPEKFEAALVRLQGPVRVDKRTAPLRIWQILDAAGLEINDGADPCILPKARKNPTEIECTKTAHLRDAHAMVEFLAWLDRQPPGSLREIDVVTALEGFRAQTNALRDISFETIAGAGPNGAIVHYRVTEETNRSLEDGDLLLVDSGGQYVDGTTDITRTIPIGTPSEAQKRCFSLVLKGMIAISRTCFPKGLAGRDLDALARAPLWRAGLDYDHGTGHGVGAYLSVHEGPQRISRIGEVPLDPGMILSNEPGYYRESAFGIRIENLIVVQPAPTIEGADDRDMLAFETLTWVPIDRRLILPDMLSNGERDWLNAYHETIRARLDVTGETAKWLAEATAPL